MATLGSSGIVPLRRKLLLVIGVCTLLIIGSIIAYNTITARTQALTYSRGHVLSLARDYASQIKGEVEEALNASRNLAMVFSSVKDTAAPVGITRDQANAVIRQVLSGNETIAGIFVVWEPNAFDGLDMHYDTLLRMDTVIPYAEAMDSFGHYVPYWFREDGRVNVEATYAFGKDWYELPRASRRELVVDPQLYEVQGQDVMLMTLESPILFNNVFYGLVGVDISINWLQDRVERAHLYGDEAIISIISRNGTLAAYSEEDSVLGKTLNEVFPEVTAQMKALQAGEEGEVITDDYLTVFVPVFLGKSETPWQVAIQVPSYLITSEATNQMWKTILISIGLSIIALLVIFFFVGKLIRPLNKMASYTLEMSRGKLDKMDMETPNDEIGQMKRALDKLSANLTQTSSFAGKIGRGELDATHEVMSEDDVLGHALIEMRDNLKGIAEEDEKRVWGTKGLALFADLLREEGMALEDMAFRVIKELVSYLGANQGGIFFTDNDAEDGKLLWLAASYAWDRQKHHELRLAPGEGLAGQCYQEGKYIYMTDVPDDYIRITSGVGKALPKAVLIVPMMMNDEINGILELASFKPFEPHQIEFVSNIGESIASTLSAIKTNQNTRKLLNEATRAREELQAQEEELRQNQEELQATHEELDRVVKKLQAENAELKARLSEKEKKS